MVFAAMQTRLGNAFAYRWRSASMPRLKPAAELRSLDILSGGRINAQAIFPHCLPSKVPKAPVLQRGPIFQSPGATRDAD